MTNKKRIRCSGAMWLATALFVVWAPASMAQDAGTPPSQPSFSIYGFAMLDMGFDSGQVDPNWFDVLRPTKLPSFEDQFGKDGNFYAGVRQSRLGFKAWVPTDMGELKTIFEFELFGTGVDAGQTTFRLRHAYGELGQIGAGQTWSPFMDIGRVPELDRVLGPERDGFLPQRAGAVDAVRRATRTS